MVDISVVNWLDQLPLRDVLNHRGAIKSSNGHVQWESQWNDGVPYFSETHNLLKGCNTFQQERSIYFLIKTEYIHMYYIYIYG